MSHKNWRNSQESRKFRHFFLKRENGTIGTTWTSGKILGTLLTITSRSTQNHVARIESNWYGFVKNKSHQSDTIFSFARMSGLTCKKEVASVRVPDTNTASETGFPGLLWQKMWRTKSPPGSGRNHCDSSHGAIWIAFWNRNVCFCWLATSLFEDLSGYCSSRLFLTIYTSQVRQKSLCHCKRPLLPLITIHSRLSYQAWMIHVQQKNNSTASLQTKLPSLSLATESEQSFQGRRM